MSSFPLRWPVWAPLQYSFPMNSTLPLHTHTHRDREGENFRFRAQLFFYLFTSLSPPPLDTYHHTSETQFYSSPLLFSTTLTQSLLHVGTAKEISPESVSYRKNNITEREIFIQITIRKGGCWRALVVFGGLFFLKKNYILERDNPYIVHKYNIPYIIIYNLQKMSASRRHAARP